MSAQPTGIRLNAKQAIWWFLVTIQPLVVEVDGVTTKGTWGDQTLPVAPGSHRGLGVLEAGTGFSPFSGRR